MLQKVPKPEDVALTNAIIVDLEQALCIDRTRVYSTGISNGAGMTALLGCRIPNRLAAIAPVSGVNLVAGCPKGTPPLSVLAFHGDADGVVGYGGGHTSSSLGGIPPAPRPRQLDAWGEPGHCGRWPTAGQTCAPVQPHHRPVRR